MSNPRNATHDKESALKLAFWLYVWQIKEAQRKVWKIFNGLAKENNELKSGGLVCGTVHKGESIINKRSISAIANIKELP